MRFWIAAIAVLAALAGGACRADEQEAQVADVSIVADVSVKDASIEKTCAVLSKAYGVEVTAAPTMDTAKITFDLKRAPIAGVLATLDAAYRIKSYRILMALGPNEKVNPEEVADTLSALKKIRAAGLYVADMGDESAVSFAKGQALAGPKPGDPCGDGKVYREVYYLYTDGIKATINPSPRKRTGPPAGGARPAAAQAGAARVADPMLTAPGGPGDQAGLFVRWFETQPIDLKVTTLAQLLAAALDDPECGGELELEVPRKNGQLRLRINSPSQE